MLKHKRSPSLRSHQADLLFEIGTEELPAAYLPSLIEQLGQEADALFQEHHLSFKRIRSVGTPRRLVLLVDGLDAAQHAPAVDVRGPSKRVAYDEVGKPTAALLGFLKSRDARLDQTKVVASDKGEYVYLTMPPATTPTLRVLPSLLPQLIGRLRAPKTMRWDASGVRFARPIRWLLARYGSSPIRCAYGRLTSGSTTWLGLPLRPRRTVVTSPESYRRILARAGVVLDQRERRAGIERAVSRLAAQSRGRAAAETALHGLLDEVTHLVERPVPLVGRFDASYLKLPREVLLASMAKYQRVFAIQGSADHLLPQFVAMLDGRPKRPIEVRKTMERILNARLADGVMFWDEDHTHLPLERMAQGLSAVGFHERLGSMAEKTTRLRALSEPLAEAWRLADDERHGLRRACQLAKADLVSTMVKEFPTLQGVMGKYYARDSHEPPMVAEAIEEHYLPIGEHLPQTLIGSALAILDKYDTLTSYFAIGIVPTGDQDPFGLRRAAQGIVEVAWTVRRPLPLNQLLRVRVSMEPFRAMAPKEQATVGQRVQRYLFERLATFHWSGNPPPADCIEAVLASPCDDLIDVMDRIVSLQRLNGQPSLLKAAKVIERTRNILKGAPLRQPQVNPEHLRETQEQQLWELYQSNESRVVQLAQAKSYAEATTLFGEVFFEPLHRFFDKVLVNTSEEALQQNRLALMQAIHALYTERIADLSRLSILQHEESS